MKIRLTKIQLALTINTRASCATKAPSVFRNINLTYPVPPPPPHHPHAFCQMEGRAVTCPPPRRRPSWRPLACFTVNSRCPRPESAPPPPPPRFPYRVKFPFCATPPLLCDPLKQVSKHQRKGIETEQKANGRPCCLGDRIDSTPCCACYFAPG